jgi:UDP-xylose:glucoside alpha-1,3-xylosyltransferase
LPWFDQDVLNVYFHDHPDQFLELPCRFNYLTDHCSTEGKQFCESAEKDGVAILHGSRGVFHKHTQLTFKAVYESIRDYKVTTANTHNLEKLLISLMLKLNRIKENISCKNVSGIFTKTLKDIVLQNNFYQLRKAR